MASEQLNLKVVDFPRGIWHWDRAWAQDGNCHVSKDKEDGKKEREVSDAIYLSMRANSNEKRGFVFHGGHSEKHMRETLTGN